MARTEVRSTQLKDGEVKRQDLNTDSTGEAVITKAISGSGINISSTGVDAGTGDVTFAANGHSEATTTTTDATETTLDTLTVNDDTILQFSLQISARLNTATNKSYWAKIEGGVRRNNGSVATLVGTRIKYEDSEGSATYTADIDVSGNDLRVRVTGAVSESVIWNSTLRWTSQ